MGGTVPPHLFTDREERPVGMMKQMLIERQEDELERRYGKHAVYMTEDEVHILDDDEYEEWMKLVESVTAEKDKMADVEEARIASSWTDEGAWMQAEEAA